MLLKPQQQTNGSTAPPVENGYNVSDDDDDVEAELRFSTLAKEKSGKKIYQLGNDGTMHSRRRNYQHDRIFITLCLKNTMLPVFHVLFS